MNLEISEKDTVEKKKLLVEHLIFANKQLDDAAKELDTKLMAFITVALGLSGWGITVLSNIEIMLIIPFIISIILFVFGIAPKQASIFPADTTVIFCSRKNVGLDEYLNTVLSIDSVVQDGEGYLINPKIDNDIIKPSIKRIKIKSALLMAGIISVAVGVILVFIYRLLIV